MEQKFCQSCGMPIDDSTFGKEADGSYAEDAGNQGREPETGHRPVLLAG